MSDRDGNFEIYVMRPDGTHERRLTHTNADEIDPAFSGPRGKRIVFASDRGHCDFFDLYAMRADGSRMRHITHSPATKSPTSPPTAGGSPLHGMARGPST